ncbi:MAG: hypothetical protein SF028_02500 [Candidatus Sumerlaeia bacterium]|nr:hypothetical protein [Candidatus Sumerlaeia bacterium]
MKRLPAAHPFAFAAAGTAAALWLLELTNDAARGGSALAPLAVLLLVASHAGLVRTPPPPEEPRDPRWWERLATSAAVAGAAAWALHAMAEGVRAWAVDPRGAAQLGVAAQSVVRLGQGNSPYGVEFAMHGWTSSSFIPPGVLLPFWSVRVLGEDLRVATVGSAALALAFLLMALWRGRGGAGLWAVAASLAAVFALDSFAGFQSYGAAAPLWPALAVFGLALAERSHLLAGLALGALAACSIGWLVLLPLGVLLLVRLGGAPAWPAVLAALLVPAVVYGAQGDRLGDFLADATAAAFYRADPKSIGEVLPHRWPSLMGMLVGMKMAPALLLWLPAALWVVARGIARAEDGRAAVRLFAAAAGLVLLCGPSVYAFHWFGHAMLLAGLWAADSLDTVNDPAAPSAGPAALAAALAAAAAAPAALVLARPLPDALDETRLLAPDRWLGAGWHGTEGAQTWSAEPIAAVHFPMNRPSPGTLEISLGQTGGEYAPFNPVTISLNGEPLGRWVPTPGTFETIKVPVPGAAVFVRGWNTLEFRAARTRSPKSLGTGSDARMLGVAWRGLRWVPSEPPPEAAP